MMSSDKRLAAAHEKVKETQAAVTAATKADTAAKTLLANVERELAKRLRRNQEKAAERGAKLAAALKLRSSAALTNKGVDFAADHLAVMESQHRRNAAAAAVDQLSGEVEAANAAHANAKKAVEILARAILAEEAEELADRIATLEGQAFDFRVKLEGAARSGVFGWRPLSLSDLSQRIIRENSTLPFGCRNTEPFVAANQNAERWRQSFADLVNPTP
jgi:hypothetical protein